MKTIKKLLPSIAIIGVILIFIITSYKISYRPEPDFYSGPYQLKASKMDLLNDSLRSAKQNLAQVESEYNRYVDGEESLDRTTYGNVGYAEMSGLYRNRESKNEVFFIIKSAKLNLNERLSKSYLQYYTKEGQGYLSRLKITKRKEADTITYIDQKVAYRYLPQEEAILIPVTSGFGQFIAHWLDTVIMVINILLFMFMLRTFIIFLIEISNNKAFVPKNVSRLKIIAIILFVLSLFSYTVNGLAYLFVIGRYGKQDMLFNYSFLEHDSYWLMASIIVYLIYVAFKKGMVLQQERDLTI